MAEFKLGRIRFVWKGNWTTGTTYYKDDVIRQGGKTFICTVGHTAAADFYTDLNFIPTKWNQMTDGQEWKGNWTTSTSYKVGDTVKYGGTVYICNTSHTSASTSALGLENSIANWDVFAEGFDWKGDWGINTRYKPNDVVSYGGITYICITGHTSAATTTLGLENNSASWEEWNTGLEYKGSWSGSSVRYKVNDIVKHGGGTWICVTAHTSQATFTADEAKWNQFNEGIEFEGDWSGATAYQIGDIVRYGGNQYVAKTNNTNENPRTSTANWDLFAEGFKFRGTHALTTSYLIGDVVRHSGQIYLASTDATPLQFTCTSTLGASDRFVMSTPTASVAVGMAVRFSGTTFGGVLAGATYYVKTVVSPTDITISTTPGGTTFDIPGNASGTMTVDIGWLPSQAAASSIWTRLNGGLSWAGEWLDDTEYDIGDVVRYGSNSYVCVSRHRSEGDDGSTVGTQGGGQANSRPDRDSTGTYWNILSIGSETSLLTTRGDLVYFGGAGPTRLPVGVEGQVLRVSEDDIPEWFTIGKVDHVYYVANHGTDHPAPIHGLTVDKPWASIRYACEQVLAGPRNLNAARLLELNRAFIQRETVEWIQYQVTNNIAPFTTTFTFKDDRCERDIGYLIDAVIWDIRHGGNRKTREAALSYVNDAPAVYTLGQETETVAAINYSLTVMNNVLAQTAPTTNYQVTNGDNSTAIVAQWTDSSIATESGVTTTVADLVEIVTDAITAGVDDDIPAEYLPSTIIHVKTGRYLEELPIIVPEGCCLLGDEVRSVNAGPTSGTTNIADSYYSLQALSRMESIVGDVVVGSTVTKSSGNTASQSKLFPYADTAQQTTVKQLVRMIRHSIDWKLGTMNLASYPDPTSYNTSYLVGYGDARTLLSLNKEYFKVEVTAFIDANYTDVYYSRTKCQQDVGYIIDALIYDLTYGGYQQSITAGLAYFNGAGGAMAIDSEELTATIAAMNHLKEMVQDAIALTPTGGDQNEIPQWREGTAGSAGSITFVGQAMDYIIGIVTNGTTGAPSVTITTIASNTTITTSVSHGLQVGDTFTPRTSANGLVKGVTYFIKTVPAVNQVTLAPSFDGTAITSLTNGTGLSIVCDIVNWPATSWATGSQVTAYTILSAAQETIIQGVIDDLNTVAWHTDFVVDATSLTTTQFRVYVGKTDLAHTYVSGGTVTKSDGTVLAITGFTYNNSTGYAVITTATHGLSAGDLVDIENIIVTCTSSGASPTTSTATFPSGTGTRNGITKVAYLQNKCIRDIRLILNAVGYDVMFNSNYQSLRSAYSYLRSTATEVFSLGQKAVTRDALLNVKTKAKANVGGDSTAQSRIETLMTLIDDIIYSGSTEGSNQTTGSRNLHYAARQLELNKSFMAAEISAYISSTFTGTATATAAATDRITCASTSWLKRNAAIRFTGTTFGGITTGTTYYVREIVSSTVFTVSLTPYGSAVDLSTASGTMTFALYYNSELCLRDVESYTDALKYDLVYPGNYKSLMAARYYANSVKGSLEEDMFYLRNSTGVRNMTMEGLTGDLTSNNDYGTRRVTAGAYCSLDPGWGPDDESAWIRTRSPYIQNNATFGRAAIGQKIDGSLHNGGNRSIVSNDFTQLISDGIGAWVTNNGRAELVSVFTYYSHIGYLAENGGKIRGTNGNNSYGDFGSVAEGFDATETPNVGIVDNKYQFVSTIGSAFTDGQKVLTVEFENAGSEYTSATMNVTGAGASASVEADEFRDDAVFQVRLLDLGNDSSGQYGGEGYLTNSNTAQGGTTTSITIAATDQEINSAYVGMKIYLTGGTGAGQYGIITAYNAGTKLASVQKETTGASGWDHLVPGTTIAAPDASTTYTIEPRISFTAPSYTSTASTLNNSATWDDVDYSNISRGYDNVSGTTSGSGTGATFLVLKKGTKYNVITKTAGTGYARLDTITIAGTSVGGAAPTNNITVTITSVNSTTGAIQAFDTDGYGQGGHYVAISTGATTTNISPSGTSWIAGGAMPSSTTWTSVAGGDLTVAETGSAFIVGRAYTIATLGNTNWTAVGAPSTTVGVSFIATAQGGTGTATPTASAIVAIAATGATAYSHDGGATWTAGANLPTSTGSWISVKYAKGRWVAVSFGDNKTAFSTNGGRSWTAGGTLPSSANWTDVTYGKGRWVVIASGSTAAAYSLDNGQAWVAATLPSSSNWNSVAYGNNRFVAVSNTSGTVAAYSLDGATWAASTLPATASWTAITYGQGVFFAVSQSTQAASSEDGIVWTSRTTSTAANGFSGVTFGNPNRYGLFVAVQRSTAGTVASYIRTGATARARAFVSQEKIFAIRLLEPGSGYASAPTMTITDPNNIYEMPFTVRIGKGALANPSFVNRGTGYVTAAGEVASGDGYGDFYQSGSYVAVRRLTQRPVAGSNVVLSNLPDRTFKLVNVVSFRGSYDGSYTAFFQISPQLAVSESPEHGATATTRIRYSQVRLTGHDFLSIGSGNFNETNYPNDFTQDPFQPNETVENNGGRVFFTSTDQDGNFRVGDLFTIEQSTGIATLNADAFNIAGLQELTLGEVTLGGASASITEFSTDPFFTADSDSVVPTQRAIKAYISAQIGGGGASLNVNSVTAGFIFISNNQITTTTNTPIQMKARFDFRGGVTGYPVAWNYFLNNR